MSPPRIFIAETLEPGLRANLPEAASHHVIHVLRMQTGEPLVLFNGEGGEYHATLDVAGKRGAAVRVLRHDPVSRESPLRLTLAQGIAKSERMDYAIQKAVELGVAEIVPLLTEHSVVRLSAERWERKREHWQGVIVSACEQSGRTAIPKLAPVTDLRDWLSALQGEGLRLMLAPDAEVKPLHALPRPSAVTLLVGPEGGFSALEVKLADMDGFQGVQLGPRVLRTETAGVAALSVLQSLWGDFSKLSS